MPAACAHSALDALGGLVAAARRVVVFTGAGISTESGIPDFRSPATGLWNRVRPIPFRDFLASPDLRRESWRRRFDPAEGSSLACAEPNSGHRAIARLVRAGKAIAVITQNIDNLHQDAGTPPERVIELHGNARYAACLSCGLRHEMGALKAEFGMLGRVGPCGRCGGIVKMATISFGQAMPEAAMAAAKARTEACDLFLVLGSSLRVQPAAGFPRYAKRRGALLAIVNREPTPLDGIADLSLRAETGAVLERVVD